MIRYNVRTKIKILQSIGFIFLMVSCSSLYKSAHQRFIEWVDMKVSSNKTLEQLGYNTEYPLGMYLADSHDFTKKEIRMDGFLIYHYAMGMLTGKYICHYHLIVDPKTNIVVDWGFDEELGDPKITCGISG